MGPNPCGNDASGSDPWADVSHEVSVDPVDDAGVDISDLKQRRDLGVPGTAIDPDRISHPPGTFRVSDDVLLGRCKGACMIDRYTPLR